MSINKTTLRDEIARAYYDGWEDARTFYEGRTTVRAETIEECAKAMEEMYSMKDHIAALTLRALKDKP